MKHIKEICKQLQATNSRIEKELILKNHKDDYDFRKILNYVFNPFFLTGISDKKISKQVYDYEGYVANDFHQIMDYLYINNTGKDEDISFIQSFLLRQPLDMIEFYKSIITKSLKLGCDAKTINKAFGEKLIPTFDVMLADKYFDNPEKVEGKEFALTLKIDGCRCIAMKENGNVTLWSRQGQQILGLIDIEKEIINIRHDNFILDGELTLVNDGIGILPSKEQYKQAMKIIRKDGEKHGIRLLVFDFLPIDDFKKQHSLIPYITRRENLSFILENIIINNSKYIKLLPLLYKGNDITKIQKFLDAARDEDQEGIMINFLYSVYEFKRTSVLLKCKVMLDSDLLVCDVFEGTGKNIDKLGGIVIEFIHNNKHYQCRCGSGFSDEERIRYWKNPELLIGKIVTIQYFEITGNDKGEFGLRFPVWKGIIRDDKDEISMY